MQRLCFLSSTASLGTNCDARTPVGSGKSRRSTARLPIGGTTQQVHSSAAIRAHIPMSADGLGQSRCAIPRVDAQAGGAAAAARADNRWRVMPRA